MLLPALVFSQQCVAVCAVVLCHVEGRATERDQTTRPAPGGNHWDSRFIVISFLYFYLHKNTHEGAEAPGERRRSGFRLRRDVVLTVETCQSDGSVGELVGDDKLSGNRR